jgi:hypothetical protein
MCNIWIYATVLGLFNAIHCYYTVITIINLRYRAPRIYIYNIFLSSLSYDPIMHHLYFPR